MSQSGSYKVGAGSGDITTLTGNTGGAVGPSAGNINIVGTGSISVAGNPGTHTLTISSSGGGGGISTLDGDTGSATGSTVTIAGGSNINTAATSATVTVNLDNTVSISGSMTAGTGFSATTGDVSISAGNIDLPVTNSGLTQGVITIGGNPWLYTDTINNDSVFLGNNAGQPSVSGNSIAIGALALNGMTAGADANTAVGFESMGLGSFTGVNNNALGMGTLQNATSASQNQAIGNFALANMPSGSFNVCIGHGAGSAYSGAEDNNIIIGNNNGVAFDTNAIRIGLIGGLTPHTSCYVGGIYGASPAMSPQMAIIGSDGLMGSQAIPTGGIVTLDGDSGSATGSTVTIAGGSNINTSATGSTVTVNLNNSVTISGTYRTTAGNVDLPVPNAGLTQGVVTINNGAFRFLSTDSSGGGVYLGVNAGSTSSAGNTAIGAQALANDAGGSATVAIGPSSMQTGAYTGSQNNAIGSNTLKLATTATSNQALGSFALNNLTTGSFNIAIGDNAGTAYTGSESNNIVLGSAIGTVGDTGVIRIGDSGGGAPQTSCFIAGIFGVSPSSPQMVTINSSGQLGSQAIPGGGITWSEITGSTVALAVAHGYVLNNAGGVTATLPATAALGDVIEIVGKGSGGWTIAQNSGQTIHFVGSSTTTGTGGSVVPMTGEQYDSVSLVCITANTDFVIKSAVGNLTLN